ncbi:MAG: hypothetical protein CSB55_02190 [Candidatus Cloacimonadota bacterium]|nr:MAG: hypothetical protein CSB55_02190 [Candidatus Cloacimonadota bacterium]
MKNKSVKYIASKFLKGRNRFFYTLPNSLAFAGIFMGVISVLIVSSVLNGFRTDMLMRIVRTGAEIYISRADGSLISETDPVLQKLEKSEKAAAFSPVNKFELIATKREKTVPLRVLGIDYEKFSEISGLKYIIRIGNPSSADFEEDGIIIGLDMSATLNVTAGEEIRLTMPIASEPTPLGLRPRSKSFKVVGIFISGMPDIDRYTAYLSVKNSQYLLGYGNKFEQIRTATGNPEKSAEEAENLKKILGEDFIVRNWTEAERNLFQATKLEKSVMLIALSCIFILTGFNMSGNFLRTVTERKKDIGILLAVGLEPVKLASVFHFCGLIISSGALVAGIIFSLAVLVSQKIYGWLIIPIPGFPYEELPVKIQVGDFILVTVVVYAITVLSTLYPAFISKKKNLISIIRNQ